MSDDHQGGPLEPRHGDDGSSAAEGAADPATLLSAYLDGELRAPETATVEAYLAGSADARAELDALGSVRTSVRSLGAVEPPAGFFEELVRQGALDDITAPDPGAPPSLRVVTAEEPSPRADEPTPFRPAGTSGGRSRRSGGPSFGRVAAAVGAAAAAVVLLMGVTPATDVVAPPVQAYAARHDEMMAAPPVPGADPTSTTTAAPSTTVVPGPGGTVEPTSSSTTAPGAAEADAMAFAPMPAAALDTMDEPFAAPATMGNGTLSRMAAYHSTADADAAGSGGVLHLMYTDGTAVISVYEQAGAVRWDALPAGTNLTIGGDQAWALRRGADELLVVARGAIVYTIVATAPHDMTMAMADELPRTPDASMPERAQAACRSMVGRFGLGD